MSALIIDRLELADGAGRAPAERFGALLAEVQLRRLFGDGKVFVDAAPKIPVADIMAAFEHVARDDAALRDFVCSHFELPSIVGVHEARRGDDVRAYICALWPELTRAPALGATDASLLPIRQPYVVPGGRFTELYYWDSYFTLLGLVRDGHEAVGQAMVETFTQLIERYGHIPNGTRTYYLSRSQPPLYFAMLELLPAAEPRLKLRRLRAMMAEHGYWMKGAEALASGASLARVARMPDGAVLNRYWDDRDTPRDESYAEDVETALEARAPAPEVYRALRAGAESGWDFSSRWLESDGLLSTIRTHRILPVDLNAYLHGLEMAIARAAEELCDDLTFETFWQAARRRRAAMHRWMWCDEGYFADFDLDIGAIRPALTAATLAPLFTGVANSMQADQVAKAVARVLLAPGGLRTTTVETGQQWDRPNGWAPLQWIAFKGLRRYGHAGLADEIAARWIALVEAEFRQSGMIHEKYNIESGGRGLGGEYVPQVGFGWTNGVTAAFMDLLGPRVGEPRRWRGRRGGQSL